MRLTKHTPMLASWAALHGHGDLASLGEMTVADVVVQLRRLTGAAS